MFNISVTSATHVYIINKSLAIARFAMNFQLQRRRLLIFYSLQQKFPLTKKNHLVVWSKQIPMVHPMVFDGLVAVGWQLASKTKN